jgi:hypothetical protein
MSAPTYEPLESLPPTRRKITAALLGHGWERQDVEETLADFAHELAEEIRDERDQMRAEAADPRIGITPDTLDAMSYAANLIDPYTEGKEPAPGPADDGLCQATLQGWPIEIVDECAREAGHYNEADLDSWHQSASDEDGNRRTWSDSADGATPHRTGPMRPDEEPTP